MRCLPGEEYADLEIAATAALHLDDDDDDDDDGQWSDWAFGPPPYP